MAMRIENEPSSSRGRLPESIPTLNRIPPGTYRYMLYKMISPLAQTQLYYRQMLLLSEFWSPLDLDMVFNLPDYERLTLHDLALIRQTDVDKVANMEFMEFLAVCRPLQFKELTGYERPP